MELLQKQPELTARSAWLKLREEGTIKVDISSSTLSRLITAHGIRRAERQQARVIEQCLKFEFFYPLECVQADCLHGPTIPSRVLTNSKLVNTLLYNSSKSVRFSAEL